MKSEARLDREERRDTLEKNGGSQTAQAREIRRESSRPILSFLTTYHQQRNPFYKTAPVTKPNP